jgi:prepilin-type processing-associated H-X9-DG protein/prepilin-type N-terminal cleavage/methylation domain-containing protein
MKAIRSRGRAFTIVELLVVVVIVAILAVLVFTGVRRARISANRTACASNLHQVAVAIQGYASTNSGEIPAVYGLGYSHGRPMAWCNPGMHMDGIGCGGLLLLVNQPDGLGGQGALPDTSVLHCPSDGDWHDRHRSSYLYCYVPRGGGTYTPWYLQPPVIDPSSYKWTDGALAGLERHSLSSVSAPTTALLIEGGALHRKGPTGITLAGFHGAGGNILYFDGHVAHATLDLPYDLDLRSNIGRIFANADNAAGGE